MRAPGRNRRAAGSANTHSSVSSPMAWGSRAYPSHDTTLPTITTSSPWPLPRRPSSAISAALPRAPEALQKPSSEACPAAIFYDNAPPYRTEQRSLFASAHLKGAVQFSASQSLPTVTCGMYVPLLAAGTLYNATTQAARKPHTHLSYFIRWEQLEYKLRTVRLGGRVEASLPAVEQSQSQSPCNVLAWAFDAGHRLPSFVRKHLARARAQHNLQIAQLGPPCSRYTAAAAET
ncbi:hypothetical protein ACCO45_004179 [Purpureocillium lilacinum]|uniref:Uncharacterized protein n=1 Tax=Purpureocillium lilacinum TaxID=33203 RepID=A0ACC4E201_PURLI